MRVLAANCDTMLRYVDEEVAGLNDLWSVSLSGCTAAQLGADASLQLLNTERLGDVVVSARIECFDLHQILITDRKDNDGDLGDGANLAAEFNAVHLRHRDVGDDEVWLPRMYGLHSFDAVGGDPQGVPLRRERRTKDSGDLRFVIDDENLYRLIVLVLFHSRSACCVTMWTSRLGDSLRKCWIAQ